MWLFYGVAIRPSFLCSSVPFIIFYLNFILNLSTRLVIAIILYKIMNLNVFSTPDILGATSRSRFGIIHDSNRLASINGAAYSQGFSASRYLAPIRMLLRLEIYKH